MFRKIGQCILISGITNSRSTCSTLDLLPDEELERLCDHRLVPSSVLVEIQEYCAEFLATYPDAQTWRDMRLYADERFKIFDEPLSDYLRDEQLGAARADLGLPCWDDEFQLKKKAICSRLKSPNEEKLYSLSQMDFINNDFIAICASKHEDGNMEATMIPILNIMTLYSCFFTDNYASSLKDVRLLSEVTDIRESKPRACTIMHEVMHSCGSINSKPTPGN